MIPKNEPSQLRRREIRRGKWREEKELRKMIEENRRLQNAVWSAPLVELEKPYQRGWMRFFRLTDAARFRSDVDRLQELLRFTNKRQFSSDRKFLSRERKGQKRTPRPHRMETFSTQCHCWREIPTYLYRYFKFRRGTPEITTERIRELRLRRINRKIDVAVQHLFRSTVAPYIITHQKMLMPDCESRLEEVNTWLQVHHGWMRHGRLRGHREAYWNRLYNAPRIRARERLEEREMREVADDFNRRRWKASHQPGGITQGTANAVPFCFRHSSAANDQLTNLFQRRQMSPPAETGGVKCGGGAGKGGGFLDGPVADMGEEERAVKDIAATGGVDDILDRESRLMKNLAFLGGEPASVFSISDGRDLGAETDHGRELFAGVIGIGQTAGEIPGADVDINQRQEFTQPFVKTTGAAVKRDESARSPNGERGIDTGGPVTTVEMEHLGFLDRIERHFVDGQRRKISGREHDMPRTVTLANQHSTEGGLALGFEFEKVGMNSCGAVFVHDEIASPVGADPIDDGSFCSEFRRGDECGWNGTTTLETTLDDFGHAFAFREILDHFEQVDHRHSDADDVECGRLRGLFHDVSCFVAIAVPINLAFWNHRWTQMNTDRIGSALGGAVR